MKKKTKFILKTLSIVLTGGTLGYLFSENRKLKRENNILEGKLLNSQYLIKGLQKNNERLNYDLGKRSSKKEE